MDRKNVKITQEAHDKLKEYCDDHFLKMSEWVSHLLIEKLNELEIKDEKSNSMEKKLS